MKIIVCGFVLMMSFCSGYTYPSKNWVVICKNSTKYTWYKNKSDHLKVFLRDNLDVMYL